MNCRLCQHDLLKTNSCPYCNTFKVASFQDDLGIDFRIDYHNLTYWLTINTMNGIMELNLYQEDPLYVWKHIINIPSFNLLSITHVNQITPLLQRLLSLKAFF